MSEVDLSAVRANVRILGAATFAQQTRAAVMVLVSDDAYGHGLLPVSRAALEAGATWLGTATVAEALRLREGGITATVFAWEWTPEDVAAALAAGIDLGVASHDQLEVVRSVAVEQGELGRVHLRVDTGSGAGVPVAGWPDLLDVAAKAQAGAEISVIGVWSDLAHAADPADPANDAQLNAFHEALHTAARHGVVPEVRHLAGSAGTLAMPGTHFDLVRCGRAVYGIRPG